MTITLQDTDACERELQELMNRVLSSPLEPIRQRLHTLEQRLREIEDLCRQTAEESLPTLNNAIVGIGNPDSLSRSISRLRSQLDRAAAHVTTLVEAGLPDAPKQIRTLETTQQAAQQTLQALHTESQLHQAHLQTQMQQSLDVLNTSNAQTRQTVADLASLGTQITALAQVQVQAQHAAAQVTDALTTAQQADQVRQSDLQASLTTLASLLTDTQQEMNASTERLQRRMLWLGVGCGTGLAATLALLAMLLLHGTLPH